MKNTFIREVGRFTSEEFVGIKSKENIVGWFSNKYNIASGWIVCELSDFDKTWIKETDGVKRVYSEKGTTIVKFDIKKEKYAFINNDYLEETGEVKFERMTKYKSFYFDTEELKNNF